MTKLYLSYGAAAGEKIHLDGADIAAPVKGAHYSPGSGQRSWDDAGRPVITEEIKIDLAGSYRLISDWISTLSALIVSMQFNSRHTVNRFMLCFLEPDAADANSQWSTYIQSASLWLDHNGLAQRSLGQQLVTLRITRLDEWVFLGSTLTPYFPNGTAVAVQGYILNHADSTANHSNAVHITYPQILGDRPARLQFKLGINQAGHALGDVLMGCGCPDKNDQFSFFKAIEGEAFNAGADAAKTQYNAIADCSNASYAKFTWSITTPAQICIEPSITGAFSKIWHGRPIKPLLRLQTARAYTDLYLKLKILAGATAAVVYETEWTLYQANAGFVEFPTLFAPPEGFTESNTLDIAIYGLKATAGAYDMSFDVLQLWPVDGGFRRLKALAYQAGTQFMVDDGRAGELYWASSDFSTTRPAIVGQGLPLACLPGRLNCLYFLNLTGGTTWLIDDQITLEIYHNVVKWNL